MPCIIDVEGLRVTVGFIHSGFSSRSRCAQIFGIRGNADRVRAELNRIPTGILIIPQQQADSISRREESKNAESIELTGGLSGTCSQLLPNKVPIAHPPWTTPRRKPSCGMTIRPLSIPHGIALSTASACRYSRTISLALFVFCRYRFFVKSWFFDGAIS